MSRYLKYFLGSNNSLLSEIFLPQLEFSSRPILRHHLVAVLLVVPAVSNITNPLIFHLLLHPPVGGVGAVTRDPVALL